MIAPLDITLAGTVTIGGELTVHRLGFGSMSLTGDGIWGPPDDPASAKDVLRRVVELGVNFIDTADSYGPEVAEELIAEALHPYPDDLVIATKSGLVRPGPGEWAPDGDPAHIRASCEGSLRRLRLERIPLYQLHRIDPAVPVADTIGALVELRDEGKIAHIGVSAVDLGQLAEARALTEVASVQNRFNIGDRESSDIVDRCEADDLTFIAYSPLAKGTLGTAWRAVEEMAEEFGCSPHALALSWLLHRSTTMLPIPGTSSIEHLEDNVDAATLVLDDDELRRLDDLV